MASVARTIIHTHTQPDPASKTPTSVTLGIPDNATAGYSPPQAIWFYNAPEDKNVFSTQLLIKSLEQTLASYPAFAGRLEHIPYRAGGTWAERFGRLRVTYGTGKDPGVETVVARCASRLADLIPSAKERGRVWDASEVPFAAFSGQDIKIALHDGFDTEGLPAAIVKLTTFSCGGIAIAARLQHVLSDAQAFIGFVHDWAKVHRSLIKSAPRPPLEPLFNPDLLNGMAAGDINAMKPDEEIMKVARDLPVHRYDWWSSSPDCPEAFQQRTKPAPELQSSTINPQGKAIPWKDWDLTLPTPHYVLHFSAEEISRMYSSLAPSHEELEFSRLDALLAHLWSNIVQARGIDNEDDIYLNFAFNFRRRMSPPLPESLLGVPACMIHAKSMAQLANNGEVRELAIAIRKAIVSMNAQTIPAFLHDVAHQLDAQRTWQFFGGQHYVTVTSWLHYRMCEVDFGAGVRPRFVEALMPGWIMQLMESRYTDRLDENVNSEYRDNLYNICNGSSAAKGIEIQRPWYSTGVDISFNLEKKVVDQITRNLLS